MLKEIVDVLVPLANTKLAELIFPIVVSSAFASVIAIVAYRYKSRETLYGSITWQWEQGYDGKVEEEPFLTIHNRSDMPAYLKSARILTGNLIKTEASRSAFSYLDPVDDSFPKSVPEKKATSFPLEKTVYDKYLKRANFINRAVGYIFKRNYIWIEVQTFGGAKLIVPANDASSYQNRPLWINLRWYPCR